MAEVNLYAGPGGFGEPSGAALEIARGVSRLFVDLGLSPITEFTLASGRRVDVAGLGPKGEFVFVEIKSCLADFRADRKWQDYLDYCDRFYFAVMQDFPLDILPADQGLIIADRFGGGVVRESAESRLNGSRRKALTLRFARAAAEKFHRTAWG
jgi:hypothetical protein